MKIDRFLDYFLEDSRRNNIFMKEHTKVCDWIKISFQRRRFKKELKNYNFLAIISVDIFIEKAFTWIGSNPASLSSLHKFSVVKNSSIEFGKYV